ncbi:MAG: hypothetical protein SFW67_03800 [Myxococcaceae bacterium]|nr:hypothetical protein [Myxococcaceae bacterium]
MRPGGPAPTRASSARADETPPDGATPVVKTAIALGGGLVAPTPATVSPLLALDASFVLADRWRLGLVALFSFGGAVDVADEAGRTRGALSARDVTALASGLFCTLGRLSLCGGLRAGLRIGIGTAAGPFIFQTRTAFAVTPTVGPAARLTFRFGRFFLAADVSGLVNVLTPALEVDGLSPAIVTPRIEGLGFLCVGVEVP